MRSSDRFDRRFSLDARGALILRRHALVYVVNKHRAAALADMLRSEKN